MEGGRPIFRSTKAWIWSGLRWPLLLVLLALAGCGGELWTPTPIPTPPPASTPMPAPAIAQFVTFSGYGISFRYPGTMAVEEAGLLDGEPNEASGTVQVASVEGTAELFQVTWVRAKQWDLEGGLAGEMAGLAEAEEVVDFEPGQVTETTWSGYRMLQQPFVSTYNTGASARGVAAAFYCERSQRAFFLVLIRQGAISEQDVLAEFQRYLESFVCYGEAG